jgi:hypothetical protein
MSFDIMKMSYKELQEKPKTLQSLTGLNPVEFTILLKSFEFAWEETLALSVNNPTRQRSYGQVGSQNCH